MQCACSPSFNFTRIYFKQFWKTLFSYNWDQFELQPTPNICPGPLAFKKYHLKLCNTVLNLSYGLRIVFWHTGKIRAVTFYLCNYQLSMRKVSGTSWHGRTLIDTHLSVQLKTIWSLKYIWPFTSTLCNRTAPLQNLWYSSLHIECFSIFLYCTKRQIMINNNFANVASDLWPMMLSISHAHVNIVRYLST